MKFRSTAALIALPFSTFAAHAAPPERDYSAEADAMLRAMENNAPEITDTTTWYAVSTDGAAPCRAALRGKRPESPYEAMPGVALIKAEQKRLPDGATRLAISLNNRGTVEQLTFSNVHGACMALTSMAKEQQRRISAEGVPVSWTAQLPASKLQMSYSEPCGIEEVVVRQPTARGGREVTSGGYLQACWWQGDGVMHVHTQVGTGRVVKLGAITVQRKK